VPYFENRTQEFKSGSGHREGGMMLSDAQVFESIRRERENNEWITGSIEQLRKSYGGRYVAVRDRRVVDNDRDFDALLARVRKLKDPESITIEFITAIEYLWML